MACKGQTGRSESARVRAAAARRVEEVGHMRDCPDRMGELERRLRRGRHRAREVEGRSLQYVPAEGGQDDSVQRNLYLACMETVGQEREPRQVSGAMRRGGPADSEAQSTARQIVMEVLRWKPV